MKFNAIVVARHISPAGNGWVTVDLDHEKLASEIPPQPWDVRSLTIIMDENWDGPVAVGCKVTSWGKWPDGRLRVTCSRP